MLSSGLTFSATPPPVKGDPFVPHDEMPSRVDVDVDNDDREEGGADVVQLKTAGKELLLATAKMTDKESFMVEKAMRKIEIMTATSF